MCPKSKTLYYVPDAEAKSALRTIAREAGILNEAVANLSWWNETWATASAERVRIAVGEAYQHATHFNKDKRQKNDDVFFRELANACGLRYQQQYHKKKSNEKNTLQTARSRRDA